MADPIQEHKDDGHRTLGRYVATFSLMVSEMRDRMVKRLSRPSDPPGLASLAFVDASAAPITKAFFRMCVALRDPDDTDEQKITGKLRNQVIGANETRNKVAHGDWYVGYWSQTGGVEGATAVDPFAFRIRTSLTETPLETIEIDLTKEAESLEHLTKLLREFGAVCFGVHGRQLASQKVQIQDVVRLDNGQLVLGPKAVDG
jgi:hypothetical protein